MDMFIDFDISYELLFISNVLASDNGLNTAEKRISQLGFAHFYLFRYFSIKIDKIDHLITEIDKIDNYKNSTNRFPSIFDINR